MEDITKLKFIVSNEILTHEEMMRLLEKSNMSAIEVSDTDGNFHCFLNKGKMSNQTKEE